MQTAIFMNLSQDVDAADGEGSQEGGMGRQKRDEERAVV